MSAYVCSRKGCNGCKFRRDGMCYISSDMKTMPKITINVKKLYALPKLKYCVAVHEIEKDIYGEYMADFFGIFTGSTLACGNGEEVSILEEDKDTVTLSSASGPQFMLTKDELKRAVI